MHTLYYSPGACSLAAHIVLEEVGEPYVVEMISSRGAREGGGTGSAEWKRVNPKGRVPALSGVAGRIGGADMLLTELTAILVYLARTHPEAGLLPTDPAAEARALEWMNWLTGAVHAQSFGQVWRPNRFVEAERDFAAVTAKGIANVREQYEFIEQILGDGREWAVPGGYSVVDPYLLVFFRWGGLVGLNMRQLYPSWTKLTYRVMARPAVERTIAREQLQIF
jgi:glutathione S-transferase